MNCGMLKFQGGADSQSPSMAQTLASTAVQSSFEAPVRSSATAPPEIRAAGNASAEAAEADYRSALLTLQGDLAGLFSIRVNDQWRILFRWQDGNAYDVRLTDYH